MNTRTTISPNGAIALPADVRKRLAWAPGTVLEVVEAAGGVILRQPDLGDTFPRNTLADLHA